MANGAPALTSEEPGERQTTVPIDVKARSAALTVIAVAAAMALLHWAREVFIPILLSIVISYALEPIVDWLTRLRLSRIVASGLVIVLLTGSMGYLGYSLADDAAAIVAEAPAAAAKLRQTLRRTQSGPGTIDTWDSLAHLSIITAVEERFGVKFSMADVGNIASFETLAKLLAERQVR